MRRRFRLGDAFSKDEALPTGHIKHRSRKLGLVDSILGQLDLTQSSQSPKATTWNRPTRAMDNSFDHKLSSVCSSDFKQRMGDYKLSQDE
jgi:hypothetical protein